MTNKAASNDTLKELGVENIRVDVHCPCPNDWYGIHTFELYKKDYESLENIFKTFVGKRCIKCGIIKEAEE